MDNLMMNEAEQELWSKVYASVLAEAGLRGEARKEADIAVITFRQRVRDGIEQKY